MCYCFFYHKRPNCPVYADGSMIMQINVYIACKHVYKGNFPMNRSIS